MRYRNPNLVHDEIKDQDSFNILASALVLPDVLTYGDILSLPEIVWAKSSSNSNQLSYQLIQMILPLHNGCLKDFLEKIDQLISLLNSKNIKASKEDILKKAKLSALYQ